MKQTIFAFAFLLLLGPAPGAWAENRSTAGIDATGVMPKDVSPSGLQGGGALLTKANAAQLLEGKYTGRFTGWVPGAGGCQAYSCFVNVANNRVYVNIYASIRSNRIWRVVDAGTVAGNLDWVTAAGVKASRVSDSVTYGCAGDPRCGVTGRNTTSAEFFVPWER